jgi:hypothetical protein
MHLNYSAEVPIILLRPVARFFTMAMVMTRVQAQGSCFERRCDFGKLVETLCEASNHIESEVRGKLLPHETHALLFGHCEVMPMK